MDFSNEDDHRGACRRTVEPEDSYLSHFKPEEVVPPEKPGKQTAEALYELLKSLGACQTCIFIGGDSTGSNTGYKDGTISIIK